jgi:hypothetical protein
LVNGSPKRCKVLLLVNSSLGGAGCYLLVHDAGCLLLVHVQGATL